MQKLLCTDALAHSMLIAIYHILKNKTACYGKVVAPPEAVSTMIDAISELALLYESDKEPYSVLTQKELDDIFLPDYEQDLDYVFDDESMIKNDGAVAKFDFCSSPFCRFTRSHW